MLEQTTEQSAQFKKDLMMSAIVGFVCAILILPIIKNLELKVPYMFGLLIILPLLSVLGIWAAYWLAKKIKVVYQIAKFILVGALNTFVDWGILNLLIFLTDIASGGGYAAFKGVSFLVANTNSYFWNKWWTFKKVEAASGSTKVDGKEFLQFLAVSLVGFMLNVGLAHLVVNVWGVQWGMSEKLWANVGALGGTLIGLTWNFLGYKLIVFKD